MLFRSWWGRCKKECLFWGVRPSTANNQHWNWGERGRRRAQTHTRKRSVIFSRTGMGIWFAMCRLGRVWSRIVGNAAIIREASALHGQRLFLGRPDLESLIVLHPSELQLVRVIFFLHFSAKIFRIILIFFFGIFWNTFPPFFEKCSTVIRKKIPTFICVFFRKLFEFFSCFSFCMLFGKSVRIILMVCFGIFCNIFRTFFDKYSINMAEKLQRYFCVPKTKSNRQHKTMTSQSKPFTMKSSPMQEEIWKENRFLESRHAMRPNFVVSKRKCKRKIDFECPITPSGRSLIAFKRKYKRKIVFSRSGRDPDSTIRPKIQFL